MQENKDKNIQTTFNSKSIDQQSSLIHYDVSQGIQNIMSQIDQDDDIYGRQQTTLDFQNITQYNNSIQNSSIR